MNKDSKCARKNLSVLEAFKFAFHGLRGIRGHFQKALAIGTEVL
jgi:hypothetical protein